MRTVARYLVAVAIAVGVAACGGRPSAARAVNAEYDARLAAGRSLLDEARERRDLALYRKAEAEFRAAIALDDARADGYADLGATFMGRADLGEYGLRKVLWYHVAATAFLDASERDPRAAPYRADAGKALIQLNRYRRAEAELEEAARLAPASRGVLADLAFCYFKRGKLPEAERTLRGLADRVPEADRDMDWVRLQEFLGRVYMKQGRPELAEPVLRDATRVYDAIIAKDASRSYWGCPYQALGEMYSMTGQSDRETEALARTAEIEADRWGGQVDAALRLYRTGDYARALRLVDAARQLYDGVEIDVARGFVLVGLRRYDEAEAIFRARAAEGGGVFMRRRFARFGAEIGLGHLALVRKDYAAAERLLRDAIGPLDRAFMAFKRLLFERLIEDVLGAPKHVYDVDWFFAEMRRLGLGWAAANQNRHAEAIAEYDAILARRPDHLLALLSKGNSLSGLKRLDEAEAVFRQVLAHYPENKFATAELGLVQYNRGDYAAAEASFQQALKEDGSTYTCPYEGLGLVYLQQGKTEAARRNLEKAIAINPDIEYKKYNGLARIYLREGKVAEAERLLRKSIANYPHDDEARGLLREIDARKAKP